MNPVFKKKFEYFFLKLSIKYLATNCGNCICDFERNEVVTREAMRSSDLLNQRGKLMDFRAVTFVWKHKAVFDVARLDGEVHVPVYKRVHNPPPEANIYLCFRRLGSKLFS
ncbi:hypothetical protein GLOIN_2v1476273 [Rhizophagus irregularis DAOM 181602=DAOM 197198]|uniref:Uncharacterized protein n=3 Tax=Rhizophagus irregularis TaxID=588596 RepID=A0A2P4Q9G5_RHIID|nr:hypothetical protein GLOIN_2v1476273 [Rhizophagus irregularis DAOM 181602=DAOM 197198]POG74279.1 hypothetical protein GLOIN_2v1476273 [Rhizophagus irregularis DAOM 181602=DAOM 197198]|eukprot:XP_025181145.1 hypothetical protein GLOIN_2v1476273 [Rhizophagus irregularis DAOM 181602=DAOM 197198]